MACSITIANVVATESGGNLTSLTVNGTVTDCQELEVTVTCASTSVKKTVAGSPPSGSGSWSTVFSATDLGAFPCGCGSQVRVDVRCLMSPFCSTWTLETIQCCPTIDIKVEQHDCKEDGTKPVTISATITPPPNSTTPVQAELIVDGPVVDSGTASSSFATLNLSYSGDLPSGNHTACVQVNQPPCGNQCTTFDFECKQADDDGENSFDCKKTYKKWFCPLLFLIMTLSFAFAIAFIILDSCLTLAGGLATIGTAFLLIGIIAFVLYRYFPDCRKCLCGWGYKLFWRVLFAAGMVITAFAGCCATFLIPGLLMIAAGLVFLFLWKKKCKKTVCEVVKEVIFVIAAFILPPLIFLLSLANVQVCFLVLFTIGTFAFTFWDLILIVFYLLILYDQANC
jgi:hypothetical protein